MAVDAKAGAAFIQHGDKYLADIYQLARQRLANVGVEQIFRRRPLYIYGK